MSANPKGLSLHRQTRRHSCNRCALLGLALSAYRSCKRQASVPKHKILMTNVTACSATTGNCQPNRCCDHFRSSSPWFFALGLRSGSSPWYFAMTSRFGSHLDSPPWVSAVILAPHAPPCFAAILTRADSRLMSSAGAFRCGLHQCGGSLRTLCGPDMGLRHENTCIHRKITKSPLTVKHATCFNCQY